MKPIYKHLRRSYPLLQNSNCFSTVTTTSITTIIGRYRKPQIYSGTEPRIKVRLFREVALAFSYLACLTNMQNAHNRSSIDSPPPPPTVHEYECDVIVIGGGSGGMAMSKLASEKYGKKVTLFDFVTPTLPHGTKWGLGGTCVNVGCVPKKLMHYAAVIGNICHQDAFNYGWRNSEGKELNAKHDWPTLVQTVQNHVKSLNFSYKASLKSAKVRYINAKAKLVDKNTVEYTEKNSTTAQKLSAATIVICTGGRPYIPDDIEGARECAITSDDLFSWKKPLGKVLVVGASYIALECAGFLTELGHNVTVAVRSILLRGFDQQCAEKIGLLMSELGTKFLRNTTPKSMTKHEDGTIEVRFNESQSTSNIYNTVIYATGRRPDTRSLGLSEVGIEVNNSNGKVYTNIYDQTNIPNIYAIGDIVYDRPELTPVAIKTGERLTRRLFGGSKQPMNYSCVPTTVFTPIEYGCCGLSEEDAISQYGGSLIEVYISEYTSIEAAAAHRRKHPKSRKDEYDVDMSPLCLSKLICNKDDDYRVLGFHYVGPNAGEVTQGMSLALTLKATKRDYDECVGIHPTDAESFTALEITKSSGESWLAQGGCGGGKCG